MDRVRLAVDLCSNLQGFSCFVPGGNGSVWTALFRRPVLWSGGGLVRREDERRSQSKRDVVQICPINS